MAAPTQYDRQISFALFSSQFPGEPHSGTSLDQEFNAVKTAMDETQANLALIQDDEGRLGPATVGRRQLDSSITIGFESPTPWETGRSYTTVSTVFHDSKFYTCLEDHTSGTFATDLAAGKWLLVADLSAAVALGDGDVDTAKLADGAVTSDKIAALAVTSVKIASNAVTESKLLDAAVTTGKIADANVTAVKLASDSVQTAKIVDDAVTLAKLVNATAQFKILARKSASAGDFEECSISELLDFVGGAARGDILYRGASAWDNLSVGAAGKTLMSDGTDLAYGYPKLKRYHVQERRNSGVASAVAVVGNGTWHKRLLDTEVLDELSIAAPSSGVISFPAGTYRVRASAYFRATGSGLVHRLRLRDTTHNVTLALGLNASSGNVTTAGCGAMLEGYFTLAGTVNMELQHYITGTTGAQSFGDASSGDTEVYADLVIEQVA